MKCIPTSALLAVVLLVFAGGTGVRANVIPSPSDDLALASNGATASSNGGNWDGSHTPAQAIDGNRDGNFGNNAMYHSAGPGAFTLTVNLAAVDSISSVNYFGRTDCCSSRDTPFEIQIFNGATKTWDSGPVNIAPNVSLTAPGGAVASGWELSVPFGVLGNQVLLMNLLPGAGGQNYFQVAELEVLPTPEPSSMVLCGLGAVGLLVAVRRRRKA